jgi:hypothetical protein
MDDTALEKILRAALQSAGELKFYRVIAKLRKEKVNPDRGTKRLFPWSVVKMAYRRQKGICSVCKDEMALERNLIEGDHWDSSLEEEQGLNKLDNCRAVHKRCNRQKGSKTIYELAQSQGRTVIEQLGDEP